jgi:hypothetical protein
MACVRARILRDCSSDALGCIVSWNESLGSDIICVTGDLSGYCRPGNDAKGQPGHT